MTTGAKKSQLAAGHDNENSLTQRLNDLFGAQADEAEALIAEILPMLRKIAARELSRERREASITPTELIHEIWLRNLSRARWTIRDRGHFYAIASLAMRRVLTDAARKQLAEHRHAERWTIAEAESDTSRILEIGDLMDRMDEELPDSARVIDMHYFAGFTFAEIAESNQLTVRQIRIRWKKGLAWLKAHHGVISER